MNTSPFGTAPEWYTVRHLVEAVAGTSWARVAVQRVGRGEPERWEWMLTMSYNGGAYVTVTGNADTEEDALSAAERALQK
jgi:hypothetical protein